MIKCVADTVVWAGVATEVQRKMLEADAEKGALGDRKAWH